MADEGAHQVGVYSEFWHQGDEEVDLDDEACHGDEEGELGLSKAIDDAGEGGGEVEEGAEPGKH